MTSMDEQDLKEKGGPDGLRQDGLYSFLHKQQGLLDEIA